MLSNNANLAHPNIWKVVKLLGGFNMEHVCHLHCLECWITNLISFINTCLCTEGNFKAASAFACFLFYAWLCAQAHTGKSLCLCECATQVCVCELPDWCMPTGRPATTQTASRRTSPRRSQWQRGGGPASVSWAANSPPSFCPLRR